MQNIMGLYSHNVLTWNLMINNKIKEVRAKYKNIRLRILVNNDS